MPAIIPSTGAGTELKGRLCSIHWLPSPDKELTNNTFLSASRIARSHAPGIHHAQPAWRNTTTALQQVKIRHRRRGLSAAVFRERDRHYVQSARKARLTKA